jgi:phosphate:Na+ symporter
MIKSKVAVSFRRIPIFFLTFCLAIGVVLILYPSLVDIGVGITILLFGILNLEKGFKIFTEGPIRIILRRSTNNLFKSINIGIFSTAILNSSSLISVLVISFITAGLISLKAGIGVVFGSNIGTTFTGWLVALFGLKLEISKMAMPMITFGIIFIMQKRKTIRAWGYVIAGLGFFFLGIFFLKTGLEQYSFDLQLFSEGETGILAVLSYTGIGILITIILQSSSATLAIILTALSVGQISYSDSLALAIGSNIGTTFTALLGSIAANQAGKKLAVAHLIFNIITGLVALLLLNPLMQSVDYLAQVLGINNTNYTLKLALFHTVFNVLGVAIMVPWINGLINILNRLIKDAPVETEQPLYLNDKILLHPQSTIHALYKETEHLLDLTFEIIAHSLNVHRSDLLSTKKIGELLENSDIPIDINIQDMYKIKIKHVYSKILKYATLIPAENLTTEEVEAITNIKNANRLIVKVIKDLELFRKNMNFYLNSDNEYIYGTYNKFRKRLLKIVKDLFLNIRSFPYQSDPGKTIHDRSQENDLITIKNNINKQREKIAQLDSEISSIIADLLSQELIRSHMASSIWNDCIYVARVGENLLEVMELLYTERDELTS